MTSSSLDYIYKDPISHYSHIHIHRLGHQHIFSRGTPILPTILYNSKNIAFARWSLSEGKKINRVPGHCPRELPRALSGEISKRDHKWVLKNWVGNHSGNIWQRGCGGRYRYWTSIRNMVSGSELLWFSISKFTLACLRFLGLGKENTLSGQNREG